MADFTFSSFQNQIIAQKQLEVLNARRSAITLFTNLIAEDAYATAVFVPYGSGFAANRGFGGTGAGGLSGSSVTFLEPYVSSTPVTPNIKTSGFPNLVTTIIPNQIEAVMIGMEATLYGLINATNIPPQVSGSNAAVAMFDSSSLIIRTSGSNAQQYTLVSEKFDTQLKANLGAANVYVQADILTGQYVNTYKVNNSIVLPTSNLATYATGADAVTVIPDTIVWATKPADINHGNILATSEYYGIPFVTYLDEDPVTHKLWVQTAAQVAFGVGRSGFGARLKIN